MAEYFLSGDEVLSFVPKGLVVVFEPLREAAGLCTWQDGAVTIKVSTRQPNRVPLSPRYQEHTLLHELCHLQDIAWCGFPLGGYREVLKLKRLIPRDSRTDDLVQFLRAKRLNEEHIDRHVHILLRDQYTIEGVMHALESRKTVFRFKDDSHLQQRELF